MKPVIDYSIYLVTDTVYFKDDSIYNKLEAALSAGVTLLQYRDKSAETRILYERALKVKALCDKYRVPLIINDRADIAFAVKAAGVHLGQGDLPPLIARRMLGSDAVIGVSAHNADEALKAEADTADYLGCGAVYATATKKDTSVIGTEGLTKISAATKLPFVGIGGITLENYKAVFNHDGKVGSGMPCEMLADTYAEHMRRLAKRIGLEPALVTGMGTAADMENVAIESLNYKELTVTAIVTGGIETNGGRVGDPADYYKPAEKPDKLGTINIILILDADMPPGTLARALVTCTEAKTAAIQELLAGSNYSTGLATGSGTDQTIIVANSDSALYFEGAGKHSKMGELIGKTVTKAVKAALSKQSGLNPKTQHNVFRRLKRFQVTTQSIWLLFQQQLAVLKPDFLEAAEKLAQEPVMLTYTSLYIHLLDQFLWGLLDKDEVMNAAEKLLSDIAGEYDTESIALNEVSVEAMMKAWSELFVNIIADNIQRN